MAEIDVRVVELYILMRLTDAGGTDGAETVCSKNGTIQPEDGRIYLPNAKSELERRIRAAFEPWRPERDLGSYPCRRVSKQITSAFGTGAGRASNPLSLFRA